MFFTASMNLEDMKRFAKTMKPHVARCAIKKLHLEFARSDAIRMYAELLEGVSIPTVCIYQEGSENIDLWVKLFSLRLRDIQIPL